MPVWDDHHERDFRGIERRSLSLTSVLTGLLTILLAATPVLLVLLLLIGAT